jgi:hypothetical protein
MNITQAYHKMCDEVKNTKDKVVDTYNNTNMSPFPKEIKVKLVIDYEEVLPSLFKAIGKIKQEDLDNFAKLSKLVENTIKKSIK